MTATTLSRPRRMRIPRPSGRVSRGQTLFMALTGLIALHVIDDSFLQPQPGTSAADHLVSGFVPLAALALAAVLYPRVRGGWQGAIALLVGFSGIVVGIEAVYYTSKVGASGDDFTGLLALGAGVTLAGFGLVHLWRTRRRHGGLVRRSARRAGIAVASVVGAFLVLIPLGYAYVATHVARPPVEEIDLGTADVEDVELHTSDDLTLQGSYVPSKNGAAVIVAFGRKGSQDKARMLARHGYGVLIFDRRGEGESDGDPNPYAWGGGEKDIVAAVEFLEERPDVDPERIGGVGLSVGGETFLQAAARHDEIKAVVSEGATARSGSELASVEGSPRRAALGQPRRQRRHGRVLERQPPGASDRPGRRDCAAGDVPDLGAERRPRRGALQPRVLPRRGRSEGPMGGPRRRARGRSGGAPARVRAPGDALPRSRAPRLERRGARVGVLAHQVGDQVDRPGGEHAAVRAGELAGPRERGKRVGDGLGRRAAELLLERRERGR